MFHFDVRRCKIGILILLSVMLVMMSGCGKKQVDIDQELKDSYGLADGPLAERLLIPAGCSYEFQIEDDFTVKIEDEDIQPPQMDQMYIVNYTKVTHDSDYRMLITNALFDEESEIYINDPNHAYVGDLDIQKNYYQNMLDEATAAGDEEWITEWQQRLSETDWQYYNATETRTPVTDYKGLNYVGTYNGYESYLDFQDDVNYVCGFSYQRFFWEGWITYRPSSKGSQVAHLISDSNDFGNNLCEMSIETAISEGENLFARLNMPDLTCTDYRNLYWSYYDYGGHYPSTEFDGYYIEFQRSVHGVPIYQPDLFLIEGFAGQAGGVNAVDGSWSVDYMPLYERIYILIDDSGILNIECDSQFQQEEEQVAAELLSFPDALHALETELQTFLQQNESQYNEIVFNDVRLSYYIIWNETEQVIQAVPVYIFAHVYQYEDKTLTEYMNDVEYLFIINALDGSMIDVIENGRALSYQ